MNALTNERLTQIFHEDHSAKWEGDNALQGLLIMSQYLPMHKHNLICGANYDVICGPNGDKLIKAGLTEDDARRLAALEWKYDGAYFSCFV